MEQHLQMLLKLIQLRYSLPDKLLLFSFLEFNFIHILIATNLTLNYLFLGAILGILIIVISNCRLNQMCQFVVANSNQPKFSSSKIHQFLRHNVAFMHFLADVNRLYGRGYFAYLLFNCPSNASILILLLFQSASIKPLLLLILLSLFSVQVFFVFILHGFMAFQFRKIHKPPIWLFSVLIKSRGGRNKFGAKFKLAN